MYALHSNSDRSCRRKNREDDRAASSDLERWVWWWRIDTISKQGRDHVKRRPENGGGGRIFFISPSIALKMYRRVSILHGSAHFLFSCLQIRVWSDLEPGRAWKRRRRQVAELLTQAAVEEAFFFGPFYSRHIHRPRRNSIQEND